MEEDEYIIVEECDGIDFNAGDNMVLITALYAALSSNLEP